MWQAAADLAANLLNWSKHKSLRGLGDLSNQMQRAALSISNNIAEGFERGTTNELITHLYYARGSAGEVRSMLAVMQRMQNFESLAEDIERFKTECECISRQIRGWTNSLQNSEIAGQRHLNDRSRAKFEQQKRFDKADESRRAFMKDLENRLKLERQQIRQNDVNEQNSDD